MKILHLIPSLNKGGAERIALDMCMELQRQGHEVLLCTLRNENQYAFLTTELKYKALKTKVQLSLWRKNQVDVNELQQEIDQFQPDVIHSHLFESEINLAFCTLPAHTKRVVHFHDNMRQLKRFSWKTLKSKALLANYYERKLVLRNLPQKTVAIGISEDSVRFIKYHLPNDKAVRLLHNAIDLKRFKSVEDSQLKSHKMVMVGSLTPLKGHLLAIQAMLLLKNLGIDFQLIIIGGGIERESLEQVVVSLGLEHFVLFKGTVDQPELEMFSSSLFIHTSFSEAFGLVLIEAMACGLPVVCTDGKGNRDLIQEGENGFMIWERDPKLLADKIQFLLENESERKRMGENAHRFAQQFGMKDYVKQLLDVYRRSNSN